MIGLDTNLLVRVLVADDAAQAERGRKALVDKCSVREPGFVNLIVLCELAWTLDRAYGFRPADIAHAIERLLSNPAIRLDGRAIVERALLLMKTKGANFPDALIGQVNLANACTETLTFDRRAAKLDGFAAI